MHIFDLWDYPEKFTPCFGKESFAMNMAGGQQIPSFYKPLHRVKKNQISSEQCHKKIIAQFRPQNIVWWPNRISWSINGIKSKAYMLTGHSTACVQGFPNFWRLFRPTKVANVLPTSSFPLTRFSPTICRSSASVIINLLSSSHSPLPVSSPLGSFLATITFCVLVFYSLCSSENSISSCSLRP